MIGQLDEEMKSLSTNQRKNDENKLCAHCSSTKKIEPTTVVLQSVTYIPNYLASPGATFLNKVTCLNNKD